MNILVKNRASLRVVPILLVLACLLGVIFRSGMNRSAQAPTASNDPTDATQKQPDNLAKEDPEIKLGLILGLTGPVVSMNKQLQQGAILAAETLNANSRVKFKLFFEDNGWEVKNTASAYRRLRHINAVDLFFVAGTAHTLALKQAGERDANLLFAWAAGQDLLAGSSLMLRHSNLASNDARIVVEALKQARIKSVGLLSIQNEWAQDFSAAFKHELKGNSVSLESALEHLPEEGDFRSLLLRLSSSKPQALVINSFGAAAGQIALQFRELGFDLPIYANNGLALSGDALALLKARPVKDLMLQHYPWPARAFVEKYQQRFGEEPDAFALISFTDLELLMKAIKAVGSRPADLVGFIKELGSFSGSYQQLEISETGEIIVDTEMSTFQRWISQ